MSPEEPTLAEVGWRLAELEKRYVDLHSQMTIRFDALATQVGSLAFVRADVYASEKAALIDKVDGAHKLAMWAVGLTASTTIGAIVTGILTMSGAFR